MQPGKEGRLNDLNNWSHSTMVTLMCPDSLQGQPDNLSVQQEDASDGGTKAVSRRQ